MAQLESGLPSVPVASRMPDSGQKMQPPHYQPSVSTRQRRYAFEFDLRYLSRVLRDHRAEENAKDLERQRQLVEPDGSCTPNLDLTPRIGPGAQQPPSITPNEFREQSGILPASGNEILPISPVQESEQHGGQIPVIPPTMATPCNLDQVPADSSEVNFVSYYTAPPRIRLDSAPRLSVPAQRESESVSMRPELSEAVPATPVADQPFKLSAQTPIAGVPECHYSAMRSRSASSMAPSPPPTPMEGVPELHDSAIAPVVTRHASPTPSPVPSSELQSPPSAIEGVPEAHGSAWAPSPRPHVPSPLSPRQALQDEAAADENGREDVPQSPVLEVEPRVMATASHSFRVPDHPVLLRSNPSPLPLTPRSQLIAESHRAVSPVVAPQELASAPSPEQALRSGASISLNGGSGVGVAPLSAAAAPASPLSKVHAGKLQVNAATSPLSPMPVFAMGADLAPAGHASVAVGTTPAHEGGFGAHTMAAAGAFDSGVGHTVAACAAARCESQRKQSTSSGHGGCARAQQEAQGASESALMHTAADKPVNAAVGTSSVADGLHGEGNNDAAIGVGAVNLGSHAGAAQCQDVGTVADEPRHDDPWCGPDGDDFMGGPESDDDIPEDPCATPPSQKSRAVDAAQPDVAGPAGQRSAPPQEVGAERSLAEVGGGTSSRHVDRVTPRLPLEASLIGSQPSRQASGRNPTPLSTGGMRTVANMLGWNDREATLRDHAMPDLAPTDAGGPSRDRENVPCNLPSPDADRGKEKRASQARTRRATKQDREPRMSSLQQRFRKRKSLAASGMAEDDHGRRYSTRKKMAPLRWYINEKKEYERKHESLPTVAVVQRTDQRTSAYAGWKAGYHPDT